MRARISGSDDQSGTIVAAQHSGGKAAKKQSVARGRDETRYLPKIGLLTSAATSFRGRILIAPAGGPLTPALSHPMGEGEDPLALARPASPSPIGWERAGVRGTIGRAIKMRPFGSAFEATPLAEIYF